MRTSGWRSWFVAACAGFVLAAQAAPLPQLVIDPAETTVSGLSSGGYMAVQLHVAFSSTFKKGAGVVAGGPFFCAEGSVMHATGRCMAHNTSIPVSSLVTTTNNWAASGYIDPVSNLANSKVYLFSGALDSAVTPPVMNDLRTYYQSFVPSGNIVYKSDIAAEHAFVTDDYGSGCSIKAPPYINDCNFDLAGAILSQLYGALNPRNYGTLGGSFVEYDQTAFVSGHGMATTGWVYVPQACAAGTPCRLHVVLHGCKQNSADVGQQYVRNTGYNRWADTNSIVMLYPQTSLAATNSCWDWWGYDSLNYAKKSGPQMAAVKAMVDRVASGTPPSTLPAPSGVGTSGATNTSMVIAWSAVNGAAGYNVYRGAAQANGSLIGGTSFTDTGLSPGTTYSWTVKAVDAIGSESPPSAPASGTTTGSAATCTTSSNYAHVSAGRAYQTWGYTYAKGSNQYMGLWTTFTIKTLKQTGPTHYVIGTC
ncbi:fibronectin type III domain-containing protein [Piscinibacter sp.]|uniref:extracellular catalytic domain type 2 short-chain-length polyhydroxyalkanoate depolymerase n=1 Tax=Piscinibacter sp. TaxID=1903157 RepID=UPI002B7072DD|nr:PHB depolymerase family esterase [Albitalea sp.]HUG23460.1 PHB depolymerase family esterase [Albitalea sp.]